MLTCLLNVWLIFKHLCDDAETKCGELAWLELEGMDSVVWKRFLCTDFLEKVIVFFDEGVSFFGVFISVMPIVPLWMKTLLKFRLNVFLLNSHNLMLNLSTFLSLYSFCPLRLMTSIVISIFFHFDSSTSHSLYFYPPFFLFLLLDQVVVHSALKIRL